MDVSILGEYAERVYAWSLNHTFSDDEARELTQEILFTALKELPRLRDEKRFEPWLWALAANVSRKFARTLGKSRAVTAYGDLPEEMICPFEDKSDDNELYARIRQSVAALSALYREIVILHYYDELSVVEIANRLGISEGTVKWRLSEARRKIRKEYTDMETTALRPQKLRMSIYGSGHFGIGSVPFPTEYVRDALSQNILFNCYEEPRGVEDLARICGVPAYYIEDKVKDLVLRRALTEMSRGKYAADFLIITEKHKRYIEKQAELLTEPLADRLADAMQAFIFEADGIGIYDAGRSVSARSNAYLLFIFQYLRSRYNTLSYPPIEPNYDGFKWRYIAYSASEDASIDFITNICTFGGFRHLVYSNLVSRKQRQLMNDADIRVCSGLLLGEGVPDRAAAADAIRKGFIIRKPDGSCSVNCIFISKKQAKELYSIADRRFGPLMGEFSKYAEEFAEGYKTLFPRRLADDVARECARKFEALFIPALKLGWDDGLLDAQQPDDFCDLLVELDRGGNDR